MILGWYIHVYTVPYHGNTVMVVYMYSGQRRSAGSAQVSGEQLPEMDGIYQVPGTSTDLFSWALQWL